MEQKSTKTQQNRMMSGSRAGSRSVVPLRSRYMSNTTTAGKFEKSSAFLKLPHVFNENNIDVTPLPLAMGKRSHVLDVEAATSPDSVPGALGSSNVSGGPFSRSIFNTTSHHDRIEEFIATEDIPSWEVVVEKSESPTVLGEADLVKEVEISLKETETFMLFELISTCVLQESDEAKMVIKRNAMYHELVKNRVGNDRYVSKGVNTFNDPYKLKLVQTLSVKHMDQGVQVSSWDMYDRYRSKKKESLRKDNVEFEEWTENVSFLDENSMKKGDQQTFDESFGSGKSEGTEILKSTLVSSLNSSISSQTKVSKLTKEIMDEPVKIDDMILQSVNFAKDLFVMERIINLNTYQPKLAKFRNLPVSFNGESSEVEESGSEIDVSPCLQKLWAFTCPLTKGHTVSCMAWNSSNLDLIAVGYGEFEFKNQKNGLACCWSIKNPEYPEKVFSHHAGVTALDFSKTYPNLLAVGFQDGGIAVYDMKQKINTPVQTSFLSMHRHTAAVSEVKWIERDSGSEMSEKVEYLITISKDGRISSWAILKGLECTDLMHLRRIGRAKVGPKMRERKVETYISRYACGTCISFQPGIPNIYMVGTEDGQIHKCSLSYNEQYLDTYNAHTAPVYSIKWSPFLSDVFLSSGGDWTVKLWHQNRLVPILKFYSSIAVESKPERPGRVHLQSSSEKTAIRLKTVYSVAWSPTSSTVFACVNHDEVEVWDLSQDILDPIIHYSPISCNSAPIAPTCVSFAKTSECLFVGDTGGNVTVLQLGNMPEPPPLNDQQDLLTNILTVSLATQLCNPAEAQNIVGCKDPEYSSQTN